MGAVAGTSLHGDDGCWTATPGAWTTVADPPPPGRPWRTVSPLPPRAGCLRVQPLPDRLVVLAERRAGRRGTERPPEYALSSKRMRRAGQVDRAEGGVVDRRAAAPATGSGPRSRRRPSSAPCPTARRRRSSRASQCSASSAANSDSSLPISASRLATRSGLVAKPSSAGSHASAVHRARHRPSEPQAIWIGAVRGREHAVRRDRGVVVAGEPGHLAGHGPLGALEGVHADHARRAARCARRGRGRCGARSCSAATTPKAPFMPAIRSAIGTPTLVGWRGAGDRHQPALALGDLVVAGARRLRAVVAEAGDRQDHQAGVELVQPRDREAEPVEHADPVVLHQHVGPGHQPGQHVAVGGVLEVEDQRLLVAVRREEVRRLAGVLRAPRTAAPTSGCRRRRAARP